MPIHKLPKRSHGEKQNCRDLIQSPITIVLSPKNSQILVAEGMMDVGQRSEASLAGEARGRAAMSFNKKRQSGRWGVVPASQHQEILVALASLIRAQRYEMALIILDNELGGGC